MIDGWMDWNRERRTTLAVYASSVVVPIFTFLSLHVTLGELLYLKGWMFKL
jgi:hypothetical protein